MTLRYDRELFALPIPAARFDPRKMDGFESIRLASARKERMLQTLPEIGAGTLHDRLDSCARGSRCHSAACPICCRIVRIRFCGFVARHIARDSQNWSAVSLVSEQDQLPIGRLNRFHPGAMKERLRQQFVRSSLQNARVYGGIDFDLDMTSPWRWCPHWYLLVRARPSECRHALERYYPKTRLVQRPMVAKVITPAEILAPATYMLKSTYKQRAASRDFRGNQTTEHQPLGDAYLEELVPLLDKWGFISRIFQKNI